MDLPSFKYHPDPVATGHVIESDRKCVCCGESRGFIYTGPVYALEEYDEQICPWCIADGSAHEKLDASFTDCSGPQKLDQWLRWCRRVVMGSKTWGLCPQTPEVLEGMAQAFDVLGGGK